MNIIGKWCIAEMDLWDREAIDLVGPAFIEFRGQGGEFHFHGNDSSFKAISYQEDKKPSRARANSTTKRGLR